MLQTVTGTVASDQPPVSASSKVAYTEGVLVNSKGLRLFTVSYRLSTGQPSAVLLFHHGYGEHVGRYKHAFTEWAKAGIAVHALDCQSMGKSQPAMRAIIWNIQDLVDDFLLLVKSVKQEYGPDEQLFIGGQSMGGLVCMLTILRDESLFKGVVLCSPAVDIHWTWIYRLQLIVGQILVWLCPMARLIPSLPIEGISQDPAVGTRYLHKHMRQVSLPMYSHHGTEDRLTSIEGVKKLYKFSRSTDTTLYEVQGGYHELLLGPEKAEVVQKITDWIIGHITKQKS